MKTITTPRAMTVQTNPRTTKGPADMFTGDVWIDAIAGDEFSRMRSGAVHFAPCARTAWHSHPCGQTLYVTEGVGLVQARGGTVIEIRPGDVIYTPPGEEHWHGAAPNHYMTHVALWEVDAQGVSANWGAHVANDEYPTSRR